MDSLTIEYAKSMLGLPYRWGGNNPLTGMDCSGFVLEVLRSCGKWGKYDTNAQGIYTKCTNTTSAPQQGTLLFFGADIAHITHIAIALDDYRMIEAGGGGSSTVSLIAAENQGAFIRIRPISNRNDLVAKGTI